MRILVLGANGMLGHSVFRLLSNDPALEVIGTVRGERPSQRIAELPGKRVLTGVDVEQSDPLIRVFATVRPQAVINCVGLVKQLDGAKDPLRAMPINALLPHRLAGLCQTTDARLIHISTDCVFSGKKGHYVETDLPDADDLYGRSKLLGEVDYPHAITLRTSIVGPEIAGNHGLLAWFLSQIGPVKGFRRALFSGLSTVELATVIRDRVLPRADLRGLYHVASSPINKFELLRLFAAVYERRNEISPDDQLVIDRSLNGKRFEDATGYTAPPWPELVRRMHEFG
ncbi:MAG TPA: SDR family oxidoreductase [Steroidobacteraceae bacterium]|jgi:dTDP-4-dehydrorhamnose reductase